MNYYLELKDYHAIKEANLKLDGITVLAGENGCGKSTIARWFYYLVNATCGFKAFKNSGAFDKARDILNDWVQTIDRIDRNSDDELKVSMAKLLTDFYNSDNLSTDSKFRSSFNCLVGDFKKYFRENSDDNSKRIAQYLLDKDPDINDVDLYFSKVEKDFFSSNGFQNYISDLASVISKEYKEDDKFPEKITLREDNVMIVGPEKFESPLSLTSAIYVDTPMAVTETDSENYFWKKLVELMRRKGEGISAPAKIILSRIKSLLGGDVDYMNDAFISDFVFHRNDGLDLSLSKVATGFKSFAYLYRLVANGHINKRTLLLIDEPEAHLHPQWIVEYARVLVMINKNLGAKIIIASHNPDMVSAIQSISKKQGVIDTTNFYLAERDEDSLQYVFKDLGHEIDEIFGSFNIALDRIRLYGQDHSEE